MPTIRGAAPSTPRTELIPIAGGRGNAAPGRPHHVDPWAFWKDYYASGKHRPSSKQFKDPERQEFLDFCETVRLLNANRKHADVQAALTAYMIYRPKMIEPWMYEALAQSIKLNGGRPADIKKYLGYAADMALKRNNPNDLVSAADMLMLNGLYERVGPLLDKACDVVPHQFPPILMSLKLAEKTRDPKRMSDGVERLLSLGWPGQDERARLLARQSVDALARTLREEGRGDEVSDMRNRLDESESRDLFVRLTWLGDADLDLVVDEPRGATASYQNPRTVFGGAIAQPGYGRRPAEIYVCPRAFDGVYTIRVETIYNNDKKPASNVKLEVITHEGTSREHKETHAIKLGDRFSAPIVVKVEGGRRKTTLPMLAPQGAIADSIAKPPAHADQPAGAAAKPAAAPPNRR